MEVSINSAYEKISRHLLEVLHDKYMLTDHLSALKKYMLLGQGDLIQQLMDKLE
jgi:gamma-tubulin complex component 3